MVEGIQSDSTTRSALWKRLANQREGRCLVLDGGLGTALSSLKGFNEIDAWSSTRRINEGYIRDGVKKVLMDFLKSGADILTANTYHPKFPEFKDYFAEEKYRENEWVIENINVANEAIDEFLATKSSGTSRPLLALAIGPFASALGALAGRATTANRELTVSEDLYKCAGYGFKTPDIRSYYNARLSDDILREAAKRGVAILAIETVGDLLEVQVICEFLNDKADLLAECGLDTWVALTCDTEDTVDTGGSVTECMEELARCQRITGLGVNCTEPHLVSPIVATIQKVLEDSSAGEKLIVAYPNSGETYLSRELHNGETVHWKKPALHEDWRFADAAVKWIDDGVRVVGGCCRILAEDIAELVEKLEKPSK